MASSRVIHSLAKKDLVTSRSYAIIPVVKFNERNKMTNQQTNNTCVDCSKPATSIDVEGGNDWVCEPCFYDRHEARYPNADTENNTRELHHEFASEFGGQFEL